MLSWERRGGLLNLSTVTGCGSIPLRSAKYISRRGLASGYLANRDASFMQRTSAGPPWKVMRGLDLRRVWKT